MSEDDYQHTVEGEVIKMIHDEFPAVRWTCAACAEDRCTIFYDADATAQVVACDFCAATHLVMRPQ